MKLIKNIVFNYKITLETGLHIGGLKDTVQIGGVDSPVYKTYKNYGEKIGTIKHEVILEQG